MTETQTGAEQTASRRQSKKAPSPHALLYRIMEEADNAHDRDAVYADFFARVFPPTGLSGPTLPMLRVIADDWFYEAYRRALRDYPLPGQTSAQRYAVKDAAREMGNASKRQRVAELTAAYERNVMLRLNSMMPNGQTLGECTRETLQGMREHLPKAFDTLIAKVKPGQKVKAAFTNATLRKLQLRIQ